MGNFIAYIVLVIAVILGTAANGFAKSAQGFTLLIPSLLTAITIVGCMYTLSIVMKSIPVVGVYKFNQMPDIFTLVGLVLIVSGVLIVNLLGKTN